MRLICGECEAPYFTTMTSAERFPNARCRDCRREHAVDPHEVPQPRVFGQSVDMGRWFGGVIPKKYSEQGRHHNGGPKR